MLHETPERALADDTLHCLNRFQGQPGSLSKELDWHAKTGCRFNKRFCLRCLDQVYLFSWHLFAAIVGDI
jgi:hypothetical protein